jgi:hypothetical protein
LLFGFGFVGLLLFFTIWLGRGTLFLRVNGFIDFMRFQKLGFGTLPEALFLRVKGLNDFTRFQNVGFGTLVLFDILFSTHIKIDTGSLEGNRQNGT